jgi:hypothetical protein
VFSWTMQESGREGSRVQEFERVLSSSLKINIHF